MRPLAVLVFIFAFFVVSCATPPRARAALPAIFEPAPSWVIGVTTKVIVRLLEWIDWVEDDLSAQLDRRRRLDPPPPVTAPPIEAVGSGSSSTAPLLRSGMIP